jgi:hypothetical protein
MFEKRWGTIPPRLFVSNGLPNGQIELADTTLFKVKQKVVIIANGEPNLEVEVKAVISDTVLFVGPYGNINFRSNLANYTIAKNAAILADEQPRSAITDVEIGRAKFDEEPTNAERSVLVDQYGRYYTDLNPVPIDGSITLEDGSGIKTPFISNVEIALANTEQEIIIPQLTKKFLIKIRGGNSKGQLSYTLGESGSKFITIMYGNWYLEENLKLDSNLKLYVQVNKPSQVIEILTWQ